MYREMVEDNVLPQRTEKSLQGVFRNHIITNINNYCDAKQCQIFNRNWQKIKVPRKNPNSRRPVVPNWNDDSEDDAQPARHITAKQTSNITA
ncbi:hypothetical protein B566_EDAN012805 [Ephemera danica]|nr:hypothetical protein B566_EDAN012805 [Ephemera danica]